MIKNVLIMNGAGVVIFDKVWVPSETIPSEKIRLFGALIATMQDFSRQSTGGLVVSYLEFSEVAISIVEDSRTKLTCTLFHENTDGSYFGQLICSQILRSFVDTFPDINFTGTLNVASFSSFSTKVYDAIHNSIRSVVQQLQTQRGVNVALVVFDDGTAVVPAQEEEQLGVIANLQPILTLSADIMQTKSKEMPVEILLEMSRQVVYVHRIGESSSLVSICRKSVNPSVYKPFIEKAVSTLGKVFVLSRALSFTGGKF
jgi:predicted regulator of Ras-like GTPase activity (Roadblock/LC7/MglB family)